MIGAQASFLNTGPGDCVAAGLNSRAGSADQLRVDDAMEFPTAERVAGPTQFGELVPATVGLTLWFGILGTEGVTVGLKYSWILLIAFGLGGWALLMRLRYSPERFRRTIGPWRSEVDLTALQSIGWKMTGGWRSQGMIFVRDRRGGQVGIYVGRFNKINEWGPLLLQAAERSGADVDRHSRGILRAHQM
jgi:hypothetical protein